VVTNSALLSGADFTSVGSVEVIVVGWVKVAVHRDETRSRSNANESQNTFELVSVVSRGTRLSGTDFTSVGGVEVIVLGRVPVAVDSSEARSRCASHVE